MHGGYRGYRGGGGYNDGPRSGGGGGGYKRHREGGRGGYGGDNKRPRRTPATPLEQYDPKRDVEQRLTSLIAQIGDKDTSSLESNLDGLASTLEHDLSEHGAHIRHVLLTCVVELPTKTPIHATLLGLLNVKNFDFANSVLLEAVQKLQETVQQHDWRPARLLVRFLAELVNANVIGAKSLFEVYDTLMSIIGNESATQNLKDQYVWIILASLPYVGRELADSKADELTALLLRVEDYLSARELDLGVLRCLRTFADQDPKSLDLLSYAWARLEQLRQRHWHLEGTMMPYRWFDNKLKLALQHGLEPLVLADPTERMGGDGSDSSSRVEPLPARFSLFDDADVEKSMTPIDRLVVEDMLVDTLFTFRDHHKEAVSQLLSVNVVFEYDHLLVQSVFQHLLRLPASPVKQVYYHNVLINMCKVQASVALMPLIANAIHLLFHRMDQLDIELVDRVADWFSFHLSHFDFNWGWAEWEPHVKPGDLAADAKTYFVSQVLQRCVRLSYYDRIAPTVPQTMLPLLGPKPGPQYEPGDATLGPTLLNQVKAKASAETVIEMLLDVPGPQRLSLFVQTLLQVGSKSFSHSRIVTERYLAVFQRLVPDDAAQEQVVAIVMRFWRDNLHMAQIVLGRMLVLRVLKHTSIVRWIFSDDNKDNLTHWTNWELLHATIGTTLMKTAIVRGDLTDARADLALLQRREPSEDNLELVQVHRERVAALQTKIGNIVAAHDSVLRDQKDLFLALFTRLTSVVAAQHRTSQVDGDATAASVFAERFDVRAVTGRLRECARRYSRDIGPFFVAMEALLFDSLPESVVTLMNECRRV